MKNIPTNLKIDMTSLPDQEQMLDVFLPLIQKYGKVYKKKSKVLARKAVSGEKIETITSDGKETENVAKSGDFVVKNGTAAKEQYILSGDKLKSRYVLVKKHPDGWDEYKATGLVLAIPGEFNFEFLASWGEKMICKPGDMICTPLPQKDEIYRIARKEFEETYE